MKNKHILIMFSSMAFVGLVWLTNFTFVGHFLKRNYTYSNYNGTFRYGEARLKGKGYTNRDEGYQYFLNNNAQVKDKQLYRTFTLDPWRFWEWHEWYYHFDRFTLPYISERTIKKNRKLEGLEKEQK